jgi:signal transduction histidine kinase
MPNPIGKLKPAKQKEAVAAAVLEERERISRELHDRALQLLSTARLRLDMCQRQLPDDATTLKKDLSVVEENLDRAITELRNILTENQIDGDLQIGSLERRLKEELDIFRARSGFKLDFQCAIGAHNLPAPVERELYFTLREGVLNAVRHSRATELHLSLSQTTKSCEARLRDNGVGFTVAAAEGSNHYGLRGMKERIRKIGGTLNLHTVPGQGTEIHISVPLE